MLRRHFIDAPLAGTAALRRRVLVVRQAASVALPSQRSPTAAAGGVVHRRRRQGHARALASASPPTPACRWWLKRPTRRTARRKLPARPPPPAKGPDIYVYAHDRIGEWSAARPAACGVALAPRWCARTSTRWPGRASPTAAALWGYPYAHRGHHAHLQQGAGEGAGTPESFDEVFALDAQTAAPAASAPSCGTTPTTTSPGR